VPAHPASRRAHTWPPHTLPPTFIRAPAPFEHALPGFFPSPRAAHCLYTVDGLNQRTIPPTHRPLPHALRIFAARATWFCAALTPTRVEERTTGRSPHTHTQNTLRTTQLLLFWWAAHSRLTYTASPLPTYTASLPHPELTGSGRRGWTCWWTRFPDSDIRCRCQDRRMVPRLRL